MKKDILGKKGRIAVGGPSPGHCPEESNDKRKPRDLEPVFYHQSPITLDEEWDHDFNSVATISLATGPGTDALHSIKLRKPYFGITLTAEHTKWLKIWLEKMVWQAFCTEGDKLFQPELHTLLQTGKGEGQEPEDEEGKPKNPKKPRTKPLQVEGQGKPNLERRKDGTGTSAKDPTKKTKKELQAEIAKLVAKSEEVEAEEEEEEQDEEDSHSDEPE